ncbi:MAG: glycosyltransferase family 2 protein [Patescibacteria group bacterium]|jgi:GT2 family glycosyltransferase
MKLSIIIVSYNTKELLEDCLESIVNSLTSKRGLKSATDKKNPNFGVANFNSRQNSRRLKSANPGKKDKLSLNDLEVIIVDNNSTDGTREYLKKLQSSPPELTTRLSGVYPPEAELVERNRRVAEGKKLKVKIILNDDNAGFAKANNQGIKKARGEYVLLLNSDTIITEKDFFEKSLEFLNKNKKVGILGPKLLWENGQVQPSGGYFPTLIRLATWALMIDDLPLINKFVKPYHPHQPGFYTKDRYYQKPHYQDWVTGACFFIKRTVIDKIGLLDEKIFMYTEEMEYCYRAKRAGFDIVYYPQTSLVHLGGKSGTSLLAAKSEFWGIKYFYQKHQPFWQRPIAGFLLKAAAFLRKIIFCQNKKKHQIYQQILNDL